MINTLRVTVTKTSDGQSEYIQVMSADQISVNVVLIASKIEVLDMREIKAPPKRKACS